MMLKKLSKTDYLFIILLIACVFLNLWKSRYGFASSDESFYVTLVDRFYKGDLMIVDEWHPSQFPAVLLIPFYSIFRLFSHGTDGVILFFRIFYIFFNTLAGIYLYIKTRRYGICSVFTTCCYLLFTVGEMMASNYNTIGLASFVVFALTYCDQDKSKLKLIVAGIFFSITVLCVPMLAVVYFIWSLIAILKIFKNKKRFNEWLYITIGIIIMAIPVTGFMLYGSSINAIIENLGYMFSQGDVHGMSLFLIIKKMLYLVYKVYFYNLVTIICFSLQIILILFCVLDKKIKREFLIRVSIIISITNVLAFYKYPYYWGYAILPIGLLCILTEKKELYAIRLYFAGLIYMLAINASSDTIIYASSMGAIVIAISSILMLSTISLKINIFYKYTLSMIVLYICIYSKISNIYGGDIPLNLNHQIKIGPLSGIITKQEDFDYYNTYYQDIKKYDLTNKKVLFFTDDAWMYLIDDQIEYATYSTWLWPEQKFYFDSMEFYFSVNKNKKADYIYIPKKNIYGYLNGNELFNQYNIIDDSNDIIYIAK